MYKARNVYRNNNKPANTCPWPWRLFQVSRAVCVLYYYAACLCLIIRALIHEPADSHAIRSVLHYPSLRHDHSLSQRLSAHATSYVRNCVSLACRSDGDLPRQIFHAATTDSNNGELSLYRSFIINISFVSRNCVALMPRLPCEVSRDYRILVISARAIVINN